MKRELTCLIQFKILTQARKSQLSECLVTMLNIKKLKLCLVMDPISDTKKTIPSGTYASRELLSMLEGIIELNQFEVDDQVTKTSKLKGIQK